MDRGSGWVKLLSGYCEKPFGRARAIGYFDAWANERGDWRGRLTSLRLASEASAPSSGQYVLRFEVTNEQRLVVLEAGVPGEYLPFKVQGVDGELPPCLGDEFGGE